MGTARSLTRAKADSGTMAAGLTEMGWPVDALRSAGLAELPPVVGVVAVALRAAGTWTSPRATGESA